MNERDALIAGLSEEPRAMTLSHDRLVLQRADRHGGRVVLVRCPHTIGLCFETDEPEPGFLGLLPCPCNDRSEIVAELVPRTRPQPLSFDKPEFDIKGGKTRVLPPAVTRPTDATNGAGVGTEVGDE